MLNRTLELTRRIDDKDAAIFNEMLSSIKNPDTAIEQLMQDFAANRWQDSSLTDTMMPYVAFLAHQNNLLSLDDFALLLFFWSASKLYRLRAVTPDQPEFKEVISATLKPIIPPLNEEEFKKSGKLTAVRSDYCSQLSPKELEEFFQGIAKLPKSQQVIFVYDETVELLKLTECKTVTDKITTLNFTPLAKNQAIFNDSKTLLEIFANYRTRHIKDSDRLRPIFKSMIASPAIMQLYLKHIFGEQAVLLNFVLGLSSSEDIRNNGLLGLRDVALHFPNIKLLSAADGYPAPWFHFTWHDLFHAFSASAIPDAHRKLFVGLSDKIKIYLAKNAATITTVENYVITKYADTLFDMDHSIYRSLYTILKLKSAHESLSVIFLLTITYELGRYLQPYLPREKKSGGGKRVMLSQTCTNGLFNTICDFIAKNEKDISATMSEGYIPAIARNFVSHPNASARNIRHVAETHQVARQFFYSWTKGSSAGPTLFSSPAVGQPHMEIKSQVATTGPMV